MGEALLERALQIDILVQQLRVVAIGVPQRPPRLVEAQAESKRVNLLAHDVSSILSSPSSSKASSPTSARERAWGAEPPRRASRRPQRLFPDAPTRVP